jgi:hypothetical protein
MDNTIKNLNFFAQVTPSFNVDGTMNLRFVDNQEVIGRLQAEVAKISDAKMPPIVVVRNMNGVNTIALNSGLMDASVLYLALAQSRQATGQGNMPMPITCEFTMDLNKVGEEWVDRRSGRSGVYGLDAMGQPKTRRDGSTQGDWLNIRPLRFVFPKHIIDGFTNRILDAAIGNVIANSVFSRSVPQTQPGFGRPAQGIYGGQQTVQPGYNQQVTGGGMPENVINNPVNTQDDGPEGDNEIPLLTGDNQPAVETGTGDNTNAGNNRNTNRNRA